MSSPRELRKQGLEHHRNGHLSEALDAYLDCLELEKGDTSDLYGNIGSIYFEQGELTTAEDFLNRGLSLAKQHKNELTASTINRYLGRLHRHRGKLGKAVNCLEASESLLETLGKDDKLLSTKLALGETLLEMRRRVEAESYLDEALSLAHKLKDGARAKRARELLDQLTEHTTLDTMAVAEITSLNLEKTSLKHLQEINLAISMQKPLEELLNLIVDNAIELCSAGRGFLLKVDDSGELVVLKARAIGHINLPQDMGQVSRALVKTLRDKPQPLLIENLKDDPFLASRDSIVKTGINSVLSVPIMVGTQLAGMFYLDAPQGGNRFSPSDMENLTLFAVQTSIALETSRLLEENRRHQDKLEKSNKTLRKRLDALGQGTQGHRLFVGQSPKMNRLMQLINRVADSDLNIIIQGESGTGKELVAEALHADSSRDGGNLIKENCGAIPEGLLESVLFGHVAGAFTGATHDKDGLFKQADGGTLFLDEIGEMPLELQKSLLRALQEGEIRPVGADHNIKVDVRVICATHRNLQEEVEAGNFREDLFYRLNGLMIAVPPLRDRQGDVPLLIQHFLGQHRIHITPEALKILEDARWPGNVRQLENEVTRWIALELPSVDVNDIRAEIRDESSAPIISGLKWDGRALKDVVQDATDLVEREIIVATLEKNRGKKAATARDLQISRPTLDAKLKKLGLE